ncbi:MAG TPA: DUF3152 domain-containing protein [Dermatophilaceae bacterium]|nr:DUF3152 domain-containing protein [Dermatophilaceae bacterium]
MSQTRTRETRNEARRRVYRRRRQVAVGGLVLSCGLLVLAGFKVAEAQPDNRMLTTAGKSQVQAAVPVITPVATPSIKAASTTPSPVQTPTETVSARATPIRATGVYATAPGGTARQGSGTLKTYAVEVETGTAQSAPTFSAAVDATLANPASWAGQGRWSLQRVTPDRADIVIRLATPATVDKVCATVGLNTIGYVSCRAGKYVMINLDRWLHAVPDYRGDVALYRQYVINHEVGHQLGYGHQSCPGPGRRAPVMQQQTFGLKGCLPNAWP